VRAVAVTGYVTLAGVVGLLILAGTLTDQIPEVDWTSRVMLPIYLLAGMLSIGELHPLLIARRDGSTDRVTASSTFALALILCGPLCVALLAQAIAVSIDDLRRRAPLRALFNVGQYMITLAIARLVFSLTSGTGMLSPITIVQAHQLLPALASGLTFFLVNNGMVAVVVALHTGQSGWSIIREDVRVQGLTSAILLGLAPVAALVAAVSPYMLALLVLPLVGVQRSARLSARRQHDALHDSLTQLPNRELFQRLTERAISLVHAGPNGAKPDGSGGRVGVILLDLDHFKEVNDTLGHAVGDGLLREVAKRLTAVLPAGMTIARLGGDEFAVLVPNAASIAETQRLAERVSTCLHEPVVAEGLRIAVRASIGIALCPDHATTIETLVQRADIALYRAKGHRGAIEVYRTEIDQHTVMRLSLMGDLQAAVDNEEFLLHFQPQVDGRRGEEGEAVAVEALIRWRHPNHGVIGPDVFIPLAENSGLIGPMSRRAVESALETLALLRKSGHDLSMAVNISARLLSDLDLPRWINRLLLATSVPPSRLTIEVTESTITADPQRAMQVLQDLREIGVRLSVDDFGTGYSSLSYLRRLQPDELKVDKSFVMQMNTDENSAVIVRSTVELGHGLGLSVVAEGVEDQATYDALTELGCDRLQGFHIARPMSEVALKSWLDARQVRRAAAATTRLVPKQTMAGELRVAGHPGAA
jgi:diguanylate cyclase (GGDEF)-like protein